MRRGIEANDFLAAVEIPTPRLYLSASYLKINFICAVGNFNFAAAVGSMSIHDSFVFFINFDT